MKKINFEEIINEFDENDFGFSTTTEDEYNSVLSEKEETVEMYKERLAKVEKIILPFLTQLLKTADQPIIKWPNRKKVLEEQIEKILNLTRG